MRLVTYELRKVWNKRNFIVAVVIILAINLFLLWYTNLPNCNQPSLSAYQTFAEKTKSMSEQEKYSYVQEQKDKMDGIRHVFDVISLTSSTFERGKELAKQEMESHPGIYERYYPAYQSGEYLVYTDNFEQEYRFIDEVYKEMQTVADYPNYLSSIRENEKKLSGISIFGGSSEDSYTTRAIRKSAEDFSNLTAENIRFSLSKGYRIILENPFTDLLIFLLIILFQGSLVFEEKQKNLISVTKATKCGVVDNVYAKLIALLIHSVLMTFILYGVNYLFAYLACGIPYVFGQVQSISNCSGSALSWNLIEYLLGSVAMKAGTLYLIGALLLSLLLVVKNVYTAFGGGIAVVAISSLLYRLIPAQSSWNILKYMNPIGIVHTEEILGTYQNLDIFGYPVSRLMMTIVVGFLLAIIAIVLSPIAMSYSNEGKKSATQSSHIMWHSLYIIEGKKLLMGCRMIFVLIAVLFLLIYQNVRREYVVSVGEQYYQNIMTELEGPLTEEKTQLFQAERTRYENAFREIDQIEKLVETGELSSIAADQMKSRYSAEVAFYGYFQKVEMQYNQIQENGGEFVYDTGYLYLFGLRDNYMLLDFLIISVGIVIILSQVFALENQRGTWTLIQTTAAGRGRTVRAKCFLALTISIALTMAPWVGRICYLTRIFPMKQWMSKLCMLSDYQASGMNIPIVLYLLGLILCQCVVATLLTGVVLLLSRYIKEYLTSVFAGLILLGVPVLMQILGLEAFAYASLYRIFTLWIPG